MDAGTWFTPKQKAELWERWKSGQCVADIARALEKEEQERCLSDLSSQWRNCAGATPQSWGSAEKNWERMLVLCFSQITFRLMSLSRF
jgi:hypothetical protein